MSSLLCGKQIKLSSYFGKKFVVLFFYPLDFTFVCPTGIYRILFIYTFIFLRMNHDGFLLNHSAIDNILKQKRFS